MVAGALAVVVITGAAVVAGVETVDVDMAVDVTTIGTVTALLKIKAQKLKKNIDAKQVNNEVPGVLTNSHHRRVVHFKRRRLQNSHRQRY